MDALFHFSLALSGAYILVRGTRIKMNHVLLMLVSLTSMAPDFEHFQEFLGLPEFSMHGLYMIAIPLLAYSLFAVAGVLEKYRAYLLVLGVIIYGHLLCDMIQGLYGVPLFYPLSGRLYMIPKTWEIYLLSDATKPFATTLGIAVAMYYGLIFLIVSLIRPRPSGVSLRRRRTRR